MRQEDPKRGDLIRAWTTPINIAIRFWHFSITHANFRLLYKCSRNKEAVMQVGQLPYGTHLCITTNGTARPCTLYLDRYIEDQFQAETIRSFWLFSRHHVVGLLAAIC